MGFFDRARFGCEHSKSFLVARYDRTIFIRKGVLKQLNTISFYVMESRASSYCTRNIHRPFTPEKEVNRKENTVGKIAKRRQIRKSTRAQIPILAKLLVHYVVFCGKENRDLSSKIYRVPLGGIS